MPHQYEESNASSSDIREIVSSEVKPILDKLTEVLERMERYHNHDIEFQQSLLLLLSKMLANQTISVEAFDELDAHIRKAFFWGK